jgi:hypothetical protein
MYKFLTKNGQTISFFVGLAITVIFLLIVFSGLNEFSMLDPKTTARESDLFNFGINAAVALIVICTIGMIAFILLNIVTNFKGNIRLLIGVGVVLVLFGIMYSGAAYEPEGSFLGDLLIKNNITDGQNGFIVGGLWTAVILTVVAFISFIVLEILNFFK